MPHLDDGEIAKLARLAKIELAPAEVSALRADLDAILGYVALLGEVDTEGVTPTAHALGATAPLRPDVTAPGLSHDEALAQAPDHTDGCFAVPHFIE